MRASFRSSAAVAALLVAGAAGSAGSQSLAPVPQDSAAGLTRLIADAALVNARVPELLRAYRARLETEMSLVLVDSGGRERTAQLEQVASDVRWRAPDRYDQRVIGYRNQSIGPTFSLMSIFSGWTTPTLYGNRLRLGVTSATANNRAMGENLAALAIHPLATNRDAYYLFGGGDTAVTFLSGGRQIPIARVTVTPRSDAPGDAVLLLGEMYIDVERKQVVRLRGRLVEVRDGRATIKSGSRIPGVSGASFVELVNVEVEGAYWLPAYQRTEMQARIGPFGGLRSIVRIVSRFHDYQPNDSSWAGPEAPPGVLHNLTFASSAQLQRYRGWTQPIGAASTDVYYSEFDDVAPTEWATRGRATRIRFSPRSLGEVFRFNRIEGLFTGIALARDFGEAGGGLTVRGSVGWAWSEQTARGMLGAHRTRGGTTAGVRLERALAHTNDFQPPLSWGATMSALLGSTDDYDYLDRRSATLFVSQALGLKRRSVMRLEVGPGSDRAVQQNISRGLFVADGEGFRPNRGIREGSYVRSVASLELNPDVSGLFVDRGIGARLQYDRADGDLRWQRVEVGGAARREFGPFQLYARADAGTLIGDPVPQAMFEIGKSEGLRSYGYKEFAGDRAALGRAVLGYTLPFLHAPIRLPGTLILPGLAPGFAAGIHAGWAGSSGSEADAALLELGATADPATGLLVPLSRPTEGVRASAELLVTFFSGAVAVGVTRPIDRAGPWRFTGRIGQGF
ncbi:MAG TPA: hypothetical protein VMY38_01475 [Gemmatimonadaceae bacterium]|nr:hypothetical protein [Gemmatimonadaceae bacterium]